MPTYSGSMNRLVRVFVDAPNKASAEKALRRAARERAPDQWPEGKWDFHFVGGPCPWVKTRRVHYRVVDGVLVRTGGEG